jgi:hypothetical protein
MSAPPKPTVRHQPHQPARRARGAINGQLLGATGFVVGLAVLGYHGAQYDVRQTVYSSQENCRQDWGSDAACAPVANNQGSTFYYGPRYYWDPHQQRPMIVAPDGSARVAEDARIGPGVSTLGRSAVVGEFSRGGFGGIGRGFSSGRGG